jgi:O-antigen ligase
MILYYLIVLLSAVPNHPWFGEEVGGVTALKYAGLLCLLYAIWYMARQRTISLFAVWPTRLFIALFAWAICSYIATGRAAVGSSWSPFTMYLSICLLFVVTHLLVDSSRRLLYSIFALVGALMLAGLYSLREYQVAGMSTYRPGFVAGDGNFFAAATLLTMPIALYSSFVLRKRLQRWFCVAALIVTFVAFVVSASRGAFVGLCGMFLVMLFRSKQKLKLSLISILAVLLLVYAPMSPIKRIIAPGYGDTASKEAHHALWRFGIQMAIEHPLTGIGLANFKPMTERYHVLSYASAIGHNTYIEVAAELGFPGLLVLLSIMISTLLLLQRVRTNAAVQKDALIFALSTGIQEGIVGFAIAAFFFSAEYEKPFWIAIFLSSVLHRIAQQRRLVRSTETLKVMPIKCEGEARKRFVVDTVANFTGQSGRALQLS